MIHNRHSIFNNRFRQETNPSQDSSTLSRPQSLLGIQLCAMYLWHGSSIAITLTLDLRCCPATYDMYELFALFHPLTLE